MIFLSNRVRIMVATKPIDFRKGHDSLAAMVAAHTESAAYPCARSTARTYRAEINLQRTGRNHPR